MSQTGNGNDDDGDGGNGHGDTENAQFYTMTEDRHQQENAQGYQHHPQPGYGIMPENIVSIIIFITLGNFIIKTEYNGMILQALTHKFN
jgi:hypothetical protein